MTQKESVALIDKLVRGEPVFIKNTGIRVLVTYYRKFDKKNKFTLDRPETCTIKFVDTPNKKAIDMCSAYELSVDQDNPNKTEVSISATIKFKKLTPIPFKGNIAKVLFSGDKNETNKTV